MTRNAWRDTSRAATLRCAAALSLAGLLLWGGVGEARTTVVRETHPATSIFATADLKLAAAHSAVVVQRTFPMAGSDKVRTLITGPVQLGPGFDDEPDPMRAALQSALRDARQSLFGEDGVMSAPSLVAKAILRVLTFFETTLLARDDSRPTLHSSSSDAGATPSDGDDHTATATAADLDWSSLSLLGGPSSHKDE